MSYTPLFFAYDFCTPKGIFPNGIDIGYYSIPQDYGRWVEGFLQPAFLHFDFTQFTSGVFASIEWLNNNKQHRFIYPLTTFGGPDSWLAGRYAPPNHASIFCRVSEAALEAQRSGRAIFLINQLWEGFCPFYFNIFNRIQDDIKRYGLNPGNVVYASSNLRIEDLHHVWRSASSLDVDDLFIPKAVEFFGDLAQTRSKQNHDIMTYEYKESEFEKDFVCFNRRPHTHRLMLVTELFMRKILDKGLVSCPPAEMTWSPPQHDFNIQNAKEKWEALVPSLPLTVDKDNFVENYASDMTSWPYRKTWFTVITETLYSSRQKTIFLSEKVFKPIKFYHPFIIVSQPYYLKKLRELGYRTFSPFFNEGYDEIEDDDKRMLAILDEIERLCALPLEEKKSMSEQMKEIVEHNRAHLLNKPLAFSELESLLLKFVRPIA